jgi:hypothetical protein
MTMSETTTTATPTQSNAATTIAHWPNQDVPCCEAHANKLQGLSYVLGFRLSFTAAPAGLVCVNCLNEKTRKQ